MITLILGDIHGNVIALEKVLSLFENKVDYIVCHGDIVNYGPWSNECVELLLDKKIPCLKGNHEEAFILGYYKNDNPLVKSFFSQTYKNFKFLNEIKNFPYIYETDYFTITHTIQNQYLYPDSNLKNIILHKDTIIGHSHYPFIRECSNHLLINTGSVGQNRKNLNIINFAIYDSTKNKYEIKEILYDANPVIDKMINENYPKPCIEYYKSKLS